jgi:hypothetical protein
VADIPKWAADAFAVRAGRLAANQCGDCGTPVTAVRQLGRCVYLEPCGHRHGQGNAKQVAKAFGVKAVRRG